MLEREVEKKLVDGVRRMGGRAYKFVSPGNGGVPDRTWFCRDRHRCLRTENGSGKIIRLQKVQITRLEKLGQNVRVLYGAKDVENFLEEMWNGI